MSFSGVTEMINDEVRKKISEGVKTLNNEDKIYLFCSNFDTYQEVNDMVIEELSKNYRLNGLYITLSQEYPDISEHLKKKGVDISKLHFIDGISMKFGKYPKNDNCTFISSPKSIVDLSLSITNLTNSGKFVFLLLDSISTLLMFNGSKLTLDFFQYLTSKMRALNMKTVIILLNDEESSKQLKSDISQFCDQIVNCF